MAPPVRTPRAEWIRAGLEALAAGGPEAVRVEQMAKALDVTKGGFYGHFADRGAFLTTLLDSWESRMVDQVIDTVEQDGGNARERLAHLYSLASTVSDLFDVELAIRDWARRDPSVTSRLKRVDNKRMDYLRALFGEFCPDPQDVEARSVTAFSLFVAIPLIAADYGGGNQDEVLYRAAQQLLS